MSTTNGYRTSTDYADLISRAVRICNNADVMDSNGHVSGRDANDRNVMWINNRHASRSTLTAADIVPVNIETGKRIGEGIEPPSETWIHVSIYKRRSDVHGIVHSHPRNILGLSAARELLRPVSAIGVFLPEDGAPMFDSAVLINTPARGEAVAETLGQAPVVVLRQHGTIAVGISIEEAVVYMIRAEANADHQIIAMSVGTPNYLRGSELEALRLELTGAHANKKAWHYYEETAAKAGAFQGAT